MTAPSAARDGHARKCCNQRGVAGLAPDLCLHPTDLPIDVGMAPSVVIYDELGVWRICAVGVCLAASVPAVAWIQESAMLLLVGALLLGAVGFAFWWVWRRESRRV